MDTHRWQQLKVLFSQVLERPPAQRIAFLHEVCDDPLLREEVCSLLASYDGDPTFLERPVRAEALLLVAEESATEQTGRRIGPYRLLHPIGHGGMGTVFLAERADGQFDQRVAVKLVHPSLQRTDLLRRLRHERQILASLQHPNIARLLDGGLADDGRPYLVMEYVEGVPVDGYCDQHRLSLSERLRLFATICDAVRYAHQNLVVHRDLKPSNILVMPPATDNGGQGRVKLLDFGIAKLLDASSGALPLTRTGVRAMTPEYASPEQVRGDAITTASDVYALGVILYQLLTGQRPYVLHDLSPTQAERVICEHVPLKPSAAVRATDASSVAATPSPRKHTERLRRRLRGDLDNIVLKALRKEPERRYGSVAELADDVRRHLAQLPVTARPDTLRYRLSKLVRRHTVGVFSAIVVALALLGGIVATTYQAQVAAEERDRAQQRFVDVRALANTLLFDLHDAVRDLPGATPAREMLVRQALTYLDVLAREAADNRSLQHELAEAYQRVGEIQGDPHFPNLGDLTGATAQYQRALDLREALWHQDSTDRAVQQALANSYGRLAVVLSWGGDNEQAITLSQHALELLSPLVAAHPDDPSLRFDAARIRSELGWWLIWAGRIDESLTHLAAAEPELERLSQHFPDDVDIQIERWRVYAYQVDGHSFRGEYEHALRILREKALPHLLNAQKQHPTNPRIRSGLRTCYSKIGSMLGSMDRLDEALAAYTQSLAISQTLATADTANTINLGRTADLHASIGSLLMRLGRPQEARTEFDEALTVKRRLYERDPDNGEAANTYGNTLRAQCTFLRQRGELEASLGYCNRALAIYEDGVASDPENAAWQENLSVAYVATARTHQALAERTNPSEAATAHRRAALFHFEKGLDLRSALAARGVQFDWAIAVDSVRAEHEALANVLKEAF